MTNKTTIISNNQQNIKQIADNFTKKLCALNPLLASEEGFSQYDDSIGDLSPKTAAENADLAREVLTQIKQANVVSSNDQLCADVLSEYCKTLVDEYETNDWVRGINVITNPLDAIHSSCYNIATSSKFAREKREQKIRKIPTALETFKETLNFGVKNDCLPRQTQIAHIANNCEIYASDSLFLETPAKNSFIDFGQYLNNEILPHSDANDYVGKEIYSRFASKHLGKEIDLHETYSWGWNEIANILKEIDLVIKDLNPGGTYVETIDKLNSDETLSANSPDELKIFLQNLLDESITQLDGKHFDIDPRLKTVEAHLIAESGSSAMYYSAPSDDFSRPGRTYYPVNSKQRFPLWEEVTTCYHEGLPGHHLQIGAIKCMDDLSKFQSTFAFNAGLGEGWALYAERLMVELGYNSNPAFVFGMLNASLFRATRVVMDIGLHCQFEIPNNAPELFPRGQTFNTDLSIEILEDVIGLDNHFARDEVHRYLGWIGQAISYKIGERTIRDIRENEKRKLGTEFSLKDFHSRLLGYGHVGLGKLEQLFD